MSDYRAYTDHELVDLLRKDDETAFKVLFERYWKKLFHFAAQKTDDPMDAENIVQDVFVALWNRRSVLHINTTMNNYLTVSVKYRIIKLLDKKRLQRIYTERGLTENWSLDDSTRQHLDFEELRKRLGELVTELPEKAALIYHMSKEEGMSHRDIAVRLGMTERAVNAQLVRIRKKLRAGLHFFLRCLLF